MATAVIPEDAHDLLDGAAFGYVATTMPDGAPQLSPVWIGWHEGAVAFNTAAGRFKAHNLQRDPRVVVCVHDQRDPQRYLLVRGRAELVWEGAVAHIEALSQRYEGKPFRALKDGEQRVIVRVQSDHVEHRRA